ncbi:hypothetical protein ABZ757_30040, partial [Streptomyces albidoflavus]
MVREPGVGTQRPPCRGHQAVAAREFDGGTEQGVVGRVEAGRADVTAQLGETRPVVLPLEGI